MKHLDGVFIMHCCLYNRAVCYILHIGHFLEFLTLEPFDIYLLILKGVGRSMLLSL